jgi:hypothetical protein
MKRTIVTTKNKEGINKLPFEKTVLHYMTELELQPKEAIDRVQRYYQGFKDRNERLMERQDDRGNSAQISLITQCTLLATAVLTVAGAFFGSLHEGFTESQIWILILVILCELISLTLGMIDYLQTIKFHNGWAHCYYNIEQEVEKKFENGELKSIGKLRIIESEKISKMPQETNPIITQSMVWTGIIGIWLFFVLILAYFLDVPFYTG